MINKLNDACCGCGACGDMCAHGAISFSLNNEGFLFPQIETSLCTECNLCEQVCPILNTPQGRTISFSVAAYALSKPKNSSSGGMFFVLAKSVLEQNGVVYGAAFDDALCVSHFRVTSIKDLPRLCGSKYVQSDCSGIYKQVRGDLENKSIVLFSGTPCQVAGLRNYLRKDYDNLLLLDLICHGVPSPGIFAQFLRYCENLRGSKVQGFLFRDNRDGWDNRFRSTLAFKNGKEEYNSMLSNLWNRIFFSELAIRKNCENCNFSNMNRMGDITLGDFWGIENVNSQMYNKDGVSLILVNSEKGHLLIDRCYTSVTMAKASTVEKEHPNLYHSIRQDPRRSHFMRDYYSHGFPFIVDKYFGYNKILDIKIRIRHFLHMLIGR